MSAPLHLPRRGPQGLLALALAAGMLAACGGDDSPAKPKIPVVTGQQVDHAQATADGFDKAAFPCCATAAARTVLDAYVAMGEGLAADDVAAAQKTLGQLTSALAAATTDPGTTESTRPFLEKMAEIGDRMGGLDLEGTREEFLDLTGPALAYARASQGGEARLAIAFCPMKPGRWLQKGSPIANPYYGSQMLRCGVFEGVGEGG